jgi:hypothetical protein
MDEGMRAEEGPHRFGMKENVKLPGSRKQEVVRDAVTGQYESPQDKGPEDYTTTEEHLSPTVRRILEASKEAERTGKDVDSLTIEVMTLMLGFKRI